MAITRSTSTGWLQDLDAVTLSRATSSGWIEQTAVSSGSDTPLVVGNSSHALSSDSPALTSASSVAPSNSTHSASSDSPALTSASSVAPSNSTHSASSDQVDVTTALGLTVADSTHSVTSGAPTLVVSSSLVVANADSALESGVSTLAVPTSDIVNSGWISTTGALWDSIDDGDVDDLQWMQSGTGGEATVLLSGIQGADSTMRHRVRVRISSIGGTGAANIILNCGATLIKSQLLFSIPSTVGTVTIELTPEQASAITDYNDLRLTAWRISGTPRVYSASLQVDRAVAMTTDSFVALNPSTHAMSSDAPALTSATQVLPGDGTHSAESTNVTLSDAPELTIYSATHALSSDTPALTTGQSLLANDAGSSHSSDLVAVYTGSQLLADSGTSTSSSDNIVLPSGLSLVIGDASHALSSDLAALSTGTGLSVAEGSSALASDSPTFMFGVELSVFDSTHVSGSDIATLLMAVTVIVSNATSSSSAQYINLADKILKHILKVAPELRQVRVARERRDLPVQYENRTLI